MQWVELLFKLRSLKCSWAKDPNIWIRLVFKDDRGKIYHKSWWSGKKGTSLSSLKKKAHHAPHERAQHQHKKLFSRARKFCSKLRRMLSTGVHIFSFCMNVLILLYETKNFTGKSFTEVLLFGSSSVPFLNPFFPSISYEQEKGAQDAISDRYQY